MVLYSLNLLVRGQARGLPEHWRKFKAKSGVTYPDLVSKYKGKKRAGNLAQWESAALMCRRSCV